MRKIIYLLFIFILSVGFTAYADGEPITADKLNNGTYNITVTSSSSMFRITDCVLNAENGEMTAVMTLSGTGYEKLYMGKGVDAENAAESDYIYFNEADDGSYTYTVPVAALDSETDCAAFSIRKQQWYDRTLVFESSSLPDNAIRTNGFTAMWFIVCAAAAVLAAVVIIFKLKKKNL